MNMDNKICRTVLSVVVMIIIAVTCFFSVCVIVPNMARYFGLMQPEDVLPTVDINYAKEYPFADGDKVVKATASVPERITSLVDTIEERINRYSNNENELTPLYYNIFGTVNRVLGKNLISNSEGNIYSLENGRLVYLTNCTYQSGAFEHYGEFSDWLKERNTDLLYILPPSINDDSVHDYPEGFESGYSAVAERFKDYLSEKEINLFDTKEYLFSVDPEFDNWFYNTDHHWNIDTALNVAGKTLSIMSEEYGLPVDPSICEPDNFDSKTFKGALLGSLGRKATLGYVEPDDLKIYYPEFDTDFHIVIKERDIDREGDFGETLIYEEHIKGSYSVISSYDTFLCGDRRLVRIENKKCDNGVRILVLKQSFANIIDPYIACAVQYMDIIDPREFNGSIRTFIEKTNPDLVMICSAFPVSETKSEIWSLK